MANRSKPSALKRQRERKKAEKAAHKREQQRARREREPADDAELVASRAELEGYGALPGPGDDGPRRPR
jgi:hypothetical protein